MKRRTRSAAGIFARLAFAMTIIGGMAAVTASASTVSATVNGASGTSFVEFTLADAAMVTLAPPTETGFSDPCVNAAAGSCSYSISEELWIPGFGSLMKSTTEFCAAPANCATNQSGGLGYSLKLGPGVYDFVVIANDTANTGIQSVTGTLDLGDLGTLPEPGTNLLMALGFFAVAGICALKRRRAPKKS